MPVMFTPFFRDIKGDVRVLGTKAGQVTAPFSK